MAKKEKTELIPLIELARRAGVTKGAVSAWIKKQLAKGIVLAVPCGRQGKLVDASNPLVKRYIENTCGAAKRGNEAENPEKQSDNYLRKIRFQTRKLQIQNTLLQERYISRNAAMELLDELEKLEQRLFSGWADRALKKIEDEGKIKMPSDKRLKAVAMIDEALQRARSTNRRIIDKFRKDTAPKTAAKKRV